jgi:hypothetical protein
MPIIATDPEAPRAIHPEIVSTPAVITPALGQALVRFLADPAGLKHDALAVLNFKIQPVETVEAAAKLSDELSKAATLIKNIEARRKQYVEPLKKEAAAVDAEAKRWRDPVEAWIKRGKEVVLAFDRLQHDRARRAEEARQEAIREKRPRSRTRPRSWATRKRWKRPRSRSCATKQRPRNSPSPATRRTQERRPPVNAGWSKS